jgi:glycosyl transferase, family 25
MRAYVINLDSARDRWSSVERAFAGTRFNLCRISGVDGKTLRFPIEEYSEGFYRWFHGRPTNPGHVGCYLSHIKALKAFLAAEDQHALICEDDLTLRPDFETVLEAALRYARHWNILRLTGLSRGRPAKVTSLFGDYSLCVGFGRLKGTGAYVLDRKAARALVTGLLPMRLPIDHALDREWFYGLRALYILPFPASQLESGFRSSIQVGKSLKLSVLRRSVATYPYQVFNEATRWLFRASSYLKMRLAITDRRIPNDASATNRS